MKHLVMGTQADIYRFIVHEDNDQQRLDLFLHESLPLYSRSYFQKVIQEGGVTVHDRVILKAGYKVKATDHIVCTIPHIDFTESAATLDRSVLDRLDVVVIAQEPDFLIINKPAGLVVHKPSHASRQVTLVDWLIGHYPTLEQIGTRERPGIVHRLDMYTSGLMIIPRTAQAHTTFTTMFKDRLIKKTYVALVAGHPEKEFRIEYRIMRHPTERVKMAHSKSQGRQATTDFKVLEYLKDTAFIQASPQTGRTHQIRVHCAAAGFPILGDSVYGSRSNSIGRQALHAAELDFEYAGKQYHFSAPLPDDMVHARDILRG